MDHREPIVMLFSGHGSQTYHMASELYERHEAFYDWMNRMDEFITRRLLKDSVVGRLYDHARKRSEPLDDIRCAHAGIFMVEYALAQVIIEHIGPPDCVIGASLGEAVAACVAGAITMEDTLARVVSCAEILAAAQSTGGMLAILAKPELIGHVAALGRVEMVSEDGDRLCVVAGSRDDLDQLEAELSGIEVDCIRLPVKHAFHSARIDSLRSQLGPILERPVGAPKLNVVSCLTGYWLHHYEPDYFWRSIREPMQVGVALGQLKRQIPTAQCLDLSPGGAFCNLVPRALMKDGMSVTPLLSPFGGDAQLWRRAIERCYCVRESKTSAAR